MNDIRRTILWVVFALSSILLWDKWQVHNGRPATFFPSPAATAQGPQGAGAAPSAVPAATGASGASALLPGQAAPAALQPASERIEVTTDVMKLVFDTRGGSIIHSEFLAYDEAGRPGKPFVLLDDSRERIYQAQSGLANPQGAPLPTHETVMQFSGERALKDGENTLTLRFESPEIGGVRLVKTYTLERGSYVIHTAHEIINGGQQPVSPQLYVQLVRDGGKEAGETGFYSTFTGPAFYTPEKKYQKVEFKDIAKGDASYQKTSPNGGYVAMVQHYFASAWAFDEQTALENSARQVSPNLYAATMLTQPRLVAPGASETLNARLFIGPQIETVLERVAPGLELVKDYGWFTILSPELYALLNWLHSLLGNWGWAIVALVVLLKIAFYWLNAKAYASMAKMKAISPRITALRERYKDKPQDMQREMMRIYREEKVNPLGGCLPILIQIPVFIALYWVLLSSVEMRGAPWILWVTDLSVKDPYYILPLVMALTTLFQTALNPLPPDPMQAKMMWIMPLVFSVMFFFFPAGLVLYWITNNILTIAQQWIINTRLGVPPQFNLPKFK